MIGMSEPKTRVQVTQLFVLEFYLRAKRGKQGESRGIEAEFEIGQLKSI